MHLTLPSTRCPTLFCLLVEWWKIVWRSHQMHVFCLDYFLKSRTLVPESGIPVQWLPQCYHAERMLQNKQQHARSCSCNAIES